MRLLNVHNLSLRDFNETNTPEYAILSHTWQEGEEISFADMEALRPEIMHRTGYHKIERCAKEIARLGYHWVWIDTCCIDKSSSAELSEAINSMFAYYRDAAVCLAYLNDVQLDYGAKHASMAYQLPAQTLHARAKHNGAQLLFTHMKSSRWFTRGWTLQELIAPDNLMFYARDWTYICDKNFVLDDLSQLTNISTDILGGLDPSSASIAQRMSWAAHRQTTRTEDLAYCLLGIFAINMPLLYGEGHRAFTRLQEEIIKSSTDQSLFAWDAIPEDVDSVSSIPGILAPGPWAFAGCRDVIEASAQEWEGSQTYSLSTSGLGIQLRLDPVYKPSSALSFDGGQITPSGEPDGWLAILNCLKNPAGTSAERTALRCTILLEQLQPGIFVRRHKHLRPRDDRIYSGRLHDITIVHTIPPRSLFSDVRRAYGIIFKHSFPLFHACVIDQEHHDHPMQVNIRRRLRSVAKFPADRMHLPLTQVLATAAFLLNDLERPQTDQTSDRAPAVQLTFQTGLKATRLRVSSALSIGSGHWPWCFNSHCKGHTPMVDWTATYINTRDLPTDWSFYKLLIWPPPEGQRLLGSTERSQISAWVLPIRARFLVLDNRLFLQVELGALQSEHIATATT